MRLAIQDFCGFSFPVQLSRELASHGHHVSPVNFRSSDSHARHNDGSAKRTSSQRCERERRRNACHCAWSKFFGAGDSAPRQVAA